MYKFEEKLYNQGINLIAGVDEVGRGCLAGDVVACAIIMPKNKVIEGVTDSKKISPKKREELYDKILGEAIACGIGRVKAEVIDDINIKESTKLAMKFAIENIRDRNNKKIVPEFVLIDAENIDIEIDNEVITKGDLKSYSIACASIVAKVYRDNLCYKWDEKYPGYNIKQHKGYGTKEHRELIKTLGPSKIHRKTFLDNILKG